MTEADDPRALVRPYTVTRGRTATATAWPPETVVAAVDPVPAPRSAAGDHGGPDPVVQMMRYGVRGPVWHPGEPGFAEESGARGGESPRVIVGVRDHDDVAVAVTVAAEHDLPVAVTAPGYPAEPVGGGVLISTRRLREIAVDPATRTVRVGAGVGWDALVEAVASQGLTPPFGHAPGVGVVDHVLRGGIGPLARSTGFAADHVGAVELVTADGVGRRVDAVHEAELFWAVRGGMRGGPRVGVVTAIEMTLDPATPLTAGRLVFAPAAATEVVAAYPGWSASLGDATTSTVTWGRDTPGPVLQVVHDGPAADVDAALVAMRARGAVTDTVAVATPGAVEALDHAPPASGPLWTRGLLLRELHPDVVDVLVESVDDPPAAVVVHHLGGATHLRPMADDAIGGRHARYAVVLVDAAGPGGGPARAEALLERLAPYAAGTATVTVTASGIDVAADPDSATRARLAELADRVDPAGRFRPARTATVGDRRRAEHAESHAPNASDGASLAGRRSRSATGLDANPEARAIIELARPWRSVAEIAGELGLPLGVVRVLLADLDAAGLVTVHRPPGHDPDGSTDRDDTDHLERALRGLRNRL